MFLRKETVEEPTGTLKVVPYCKDCKSMEIETIRTCKDCGSHNIGIPSNINYLIDGNSLGIKPELKEVDKYIYKCDKCGKEFNLKESDKYISYCDGEFETFKISDAEAECGNNIIYHIDADLCKECKNKLALKLQHKILNIINVYNVKKEIEMFIDDK